MSLIQFCQKVYGLYFSKPVESRPICRAVIQRKPTRIVELGIGTGERTLQMLQLACKSSPEATVQYTGIDLFEARPETVGPGMRLKDAYRSLQMPNVKLRLMPGDPLVLSNLANSLPETDLIVISKCQDPMALEKAWFYVPRMLHAESLILQENADGIDFREVTQDELPEQMAMRRAA